MKLTRRTLKLQLKNMPLDKYDYNRQLADRLYMFMQQENGIGLSANQVGLRDRCFVMGIDGQRWNCFNPEIISSHNDLVDFNEGCLSFPGESCIIARPNTISVRYFNELGQEKLETLTGLPSRCFQHELDHLNGITMWDRHKEQNAK